MGKQTAQAKEILTVQEGQMLYTINTCVIPLAIALQFWPFKRQSMKWFPETAVNGVHKKYFVV